jgi:hypothetical protein
MQLKDYVERVLELENQCEQLEQQLQSAQQQQQQQTISRPAGTSGKDHGEQQQQQVFELQMQARTAEAKARRLEAHIMQLFGPDAAAEVGGEEPGAGPGDRTLGSSRGMAAQDGGGDTGIGAGATSFSGGGVDVKRRSTSGSGHMKQQGKLNGREVELLSTITNLKAALERAMASSTPNTKYMQVRQLGRTNSITSLIKSNYAAEASSTYCPGSARQCGNG